MIFRRDAQSVLVHNQRLLSTPPQFSSDGRAWWDGTAWRPVSADHRWWWDGSRWQALTPSVGEQVVLTQQLASPQYSPDGRFQWNGRQWVPSNMPRTWLWWWNGTRWVPSQSPIGRAFTRVGIGLGFWLIGCLLFGGFLLFALVIALRSLH